jgi:hypothetical protein
LAVDAILNKKPEKLAKDLIASAYGLPYTQKVNIT